MENQSLEEGSGFSGFGSNPNNSFPNTTYSRGAAYISDIHFLEKLAEHEYDPEAMELLIVGGGACLVRNFGEFARKRVTIIEDICANAKGFEYIAEGVLAKQGGMF